MDYQSPKLFTGQYVYPYTRMPYNPYKACIASLLHWTKDIRDPYASLFYSELIEILRYMAKYPECFWCNRTKKHHKIPPPNCNGEWCYLSDHVAVREEHRSWLKKHFGLSLSRRIYDSKDTPQDDNEWQKDNGRWGIIVWTLGIGIAYKWWTR